MSFRKRNIVVGRSPSDTDVAEPSSTNTRTGVKPSPFTSQPLVSTGASSLDGILGGHGGLALGSSLLLEESGTTDYAGALLRFYAAEGICHGHVIHVVGVGDSWVRELPGVADERPNDKKPVGKDVEDRMKIAWRYEKLGQAGERVLPNRSASTSTQPPQSEAASFCHTFDLTKRLSIPQEARVYHIQPTSSAFPFTPIIKSLEQSLKTFPSNSIHRLVVPAILSPATYPPHTSKPENFLQFLHALRGLLRQYSTRLTAMITIPLALYPRSLGLVRWAEILSDGVLEFTPFPHLMDTSSDIFVERGSAGQTEEQPQGMVRVHKLPVSTERGEGGAGVGNSIGEDLAFTVSRRKFVIRPFSLPPLEGDQEAQKDAGKLTGKEMEF